MTSCGSAPRFSSRTTRTSVVDSSRTSTGPELLADDHLGDLLDDQLALDAVGDARDDHR
jgi:hypothetical protein